MAPEQSSESTPASSGDPYKGHDLNRQPFNSRAPQDYDRATLGFRGVELRHQSPAIQAYDPGHGDRNYSHAGPGPGQMPQGTSENASGFRGKGPTGYRRSDARLREEIHAVLTDHPDLDASAIEVNVENGEVTLSGHVSNRQARRIAEDSLERISGIKEVFNRLRIKSPSESDGG